MNVLWVWYWIFIVKIESIVGELQWENKYSLHLAGYAAAAICVNMVWLHLEEFEVGKKDRLSFSINVNSMILF